MPWEVTGDGCACVQGGLSVSNVNAGARIVPGKCESYRQEGGNASSFQGKAGGDQLDGWRSIGMNCFYTIALRKGLNIFQRKGLNKAICVSEESLMKSCNEIFNGIL